MKDKIDLAEKLEAPEAMPDKESQEPYYPQVSLSNPDLVSLPNVGRSVIEHEVVRREHTKHSSGKHHHRVTLKIKSIRPMGRRRATSRTNTAEAAMRDLMD
jgi:hypothetical protein